MSLSNYERVGKMELLKAELAPFAEREVFARLHIGEAQGLIQDFAAGDRILQGKSIDGWDVSALLNFLLIK